MRTDNPRQREALKSILKDLTIALSEDKKIRNVELTDSDSKFGDAPTNDLLRINPNHAKLLGAEDKISELQEFSLIISTQSHELEHQIVTDINVISDFARQYPQRKRMAAYVMNIVEDTYIDKRRTDRDRGLRPVNALFSELWMDNQPEIKSVNGTKKYTTAMTQIARGNGSPKGFENVEDEQFKTYCAKVRKEINNVKNTYVQTEREKIAHKIMDLIEDEIGKAEISNDVELPKHVPNVNGESLPEATQENVQEKPDNSENSPKNSNKTICPKCQNKSVNTDNVSLDGMDAAKCTPPFNKNASWIENCEFIMNKEEEGLCGFRIQTSQPEKIPKKKINSEGYKMSKVSSAYEILEPKNRYDDTETIKECVCPTCKHEWVEMN